MAKVLLVETDIPYSDILKSFLEAKGHRVICTHNAQAAIHAADKNKPDVVITELLLGGHNGVEFLHEFRSYADWQETPVIVLSQIPENRSGLSKLLSDQFKDISYLPKSTSRLSMIRERVEYVTEGA